MDKETLYEMAQQMMTIAQQILTLLGEKRQASFELWSLQWYSTYKKPYVSEKQSEIIQICLRKHIPQWFKDKDLMDITTFDIETALAEVKSSKMRQLTYDTIAGVLASAYENELILKNPVIKIKRPKHNEVIGQPLSIDEIKTLFAHSSARLNLYYRFMLCTGCRRGEALSVRWSDIDYKHQYIHIRGTKTRGSDRIVPLFDDILPILESIPHNIDDNGFIFDLDGAYASRHFSKVLKNHRLHDLRHTFATRCAECDVNDDVVKAWLGHTRMVTTQRYTHIRSAKRQAEAEKFHLF